MRTSSNDIGRGNIDTRHPCKGQTSSCTNKGTKEYVKHHIPGQKNNHLGKSEDVSGPGQGTSAGYEITDGHCISPTGNPMKGKDLEEDGETLERRTRQLLEGYHLA